MDAFYSPLMQFVFKHLNTIRLGNKNIDTICSGCLNGYYQIANFAHLKVHWQEAYNPAAPLRNGERGQ